MARKDWVYINFEKSLMDQVDKVVKSAKSHGVNTYYDKKDFAVKAIQRLLDFELTRKEGCISC